MLPQTAQAPRRVDPAARQEIDGVGFALSETIGVVRARHVQRIAEGPAPVDRLAAAELDEAREEIVALCTERDEVERAAGLDPWTARSARLERAAPRSAAEARRQLRLVEQQVEGLVVLMARLDEASPAQATLADEVLTLEAYAEALGAIGEAPALLTA